MPFVAFGCCSKIDGELDRAVLADFDVSRVSSVGNTTAMAAGTEPFIAPEVAMRAELSPSADMFSFGITMVCVLLPHIWQNRMPKTTAEVLKMFEGDPCGLSKHLLQEPFAEEASAGGSGAVVDAMELKQVSDVLTRLLNADASKRPSAEEVLDHPFFAQVQLVEAPPLVPTIPPQVLGECLVYHVTHGGEQACSRGVNWEQTHFNEAAVQFHLMMGLQRNARAREVLVTVNDKLRAQFESKREALKAAGKPTSEIWVFHGTGSQASIDSILTEGFRIPPAGAEPNGAAYGRGASMNIVG